MKRLHKKLHLLNPKEISFSPDNPRGLSKEQIINTPQFEKLVFSIKDHGVLEPLIVKRDAMKVNEFFLIDGERRLRASIKAKQNEVPALVAKDDTDGRILAYQVHMLRENWDKAAETKAIKKIISDLKNKNPDIMDKEIRREIEEITSHTPHEIDDLLRLIRFDDKIIEKVIRNELNMSYLIHIDANFVRPLRAHYPDILKKYGEEKIREILIQKALDNKLVNTRFLMDKFKKVFNDTKNKEEIEKLLMKFIEKENLSIQKIYDDYESLIKGAKKEAKTPRKKTKRKTTSKKTDIPNTFSPKSIKVTKKQQILISDVRGKVESIGSSFSETELRYIEEAVFCLETHCFKAATLMIWSSGIERILEFVKKDFGDFNRATTSMKRNKTSVWKHFADNFQRNVTSKEDFMFRSNDLHLLCYLAYKKIISVPRFHDLRAHYQTRCNCAHPTDIDLAPNNVVSIFENIYDYIFNNQKLK